MVKADEWQKKLEKELEMAKEKGHIPESVIELLSELRIHQTELEMQNEELKESQQELSELYQQYHELYDEAPLGYFTLDKDGIIRDVNNKGTELLQLKKGKIIGRGFGRFIPKGCENKFYQSLANVVDTGEAQKVEIQLKRNGALFYAQMEIFPLFNRDEGKYRITVTEIAPYNQAEESLQESEKKFQTLVENSLDVISRFDQEHRHLYVNPAGERTTGMPAAAIVGKTHRELGMPDAICDQTERELNQAFAGKELTSQFEYVDATGRKKHFYSLLSPERAADGSVQTVLTISRDVTELVEAQQALQENEKKYKHIVDFAPTGIYEIDYKGPSFKNVNDAMCQITGYTRDELMVMNPFDLLSDESKIIFGQRIQKGLEGKKIDKNVDFKVITKDGREIWANLNVKLTYKNGKLDGALVVAHDITERKQAEKAMLESQNLFVSVLEGTSDPVYIKDFESRIIMANSALAKIVGKPLDQIIGKLDSEYYDNQEVGQALRDHDLQIINSGQSDIMEETVPTHDGYHTFISNKAPYYDINGKIIGIIGISHDITELKKAEEELKESKEKFQALIESNMDFVWEIDAQGKYTYCSPQMKSLWGIKPEDMIGKTPFDVMPEEERDYALKQFKELISSATSFSGLESIAYDGQGNLIFIEISGVPFFDDKGVLLGFRGITKDITESKKAEEALKENQERLNLAQKVTNIGIFEVDIQTEADIWTPELEAMYGLKEGEFGGTYDNWKELIHPEDRLEAVRRCDISIETGEPMESEWRVIWPDGSAHWLSGRWQVLKNDNGKPLKMIGVNIDITERKKAEEALKESEERFDLAVNATHEGIWDWNMETNEVWYSHRYKEMLGYSDNEIEHHLSAWLRLVHLEDKTRVLRLVDAVLRGEQDYEFEFRLRHKDGHYLNILSRGFPVRRESDGKVVRIVGTHFDLTERNQIVEELRQARDNLEENVRKRTFELNEEVEDVKVLHKLNTKFIGGEELDLILQDVLNVAISITHADKGNIQLFDPSTGALEIVVSKNFNAQFLKFFESVNPEGPSTCSTAMELKECVIADDVTKSPIFQGTDALNVLLEEGVKAVQSTPIISRNGELLGMISTHFNKVHKPAERELRFIDILARQAADIIQRKKAEKEIEFAGKYNRSLIEASLDPLVTIGPDGKITDVNKSTEQITGRSRDELTGTDFSYYFTEPEKAKEGYQRVFTKGEVRDYPLEIQHKKGHITPVLYHASVYKDESGKIIGIFAAARDITQLKRAEEERQKLLEQAQQIAEELEVSNEELESTTEELQSANKELKFASNYNRNLIEVSVDPMVTIGPDGKITDVNGATEAVTGYSRYELIGTDFSDYFTQPHKAKEGYIQVFKDGWVIDYPLEIQHKKGHITPVLYNASVYEDESGKVIGVFATARDITERKLAEAEKQKSLEQAQQIAEELEASNEELQSTTEELQASNEELQITTKELQVVNKDLKFASEYNRSLIEASVDPLVTIGPNGKITDVNEATELATGYSRDDLIGTDFSNYFTDPEKAKSGYERVFREGKVRDYPLEIKHKNGQLTPVLYHATTYKDDSGEVIGVFAAARDITERKKAEERIQRLANVVESSDDAIISKTLDGIITSWNKGAEILYGYTTDEINGKHISILKPPSLKDEIEHFIEKIKHGERVSHYETVRISKDGREIDISLTLSPILDTSGKLIGISTIARDITEQKQAEEYLKNTLKELERSNKELQSFAYITSHDLQEPLRSIASFTQLLERRYKGQLDSDADEFIEYIVSAAKRMKDMIQGLLEYSHVDTRNEPFKEFESEEAVNNALIHLHSSIEECNAKITIKDLPAINGDEHQIMRVFQNLVGNALKFQKEEVQPEIHISAKKENGECVFSVADNGIGMEEQYSKKIFEPFKRLHTIDEYEGTGIGLAVVKRIVDHHGGQIWFESELEKGSTFYFTVPVEPVNGGGHSFKIWQS